MHAAKLIAITKSLGDLEKYSAEDLIVYMARVSSPKNQGNVESSVKLLRYLIKHGHLSPLQMVTATLELTTTRAVSRQLIRHRSLNFQEYSGRYAEMPKEVIGQECRLQDVKNRQNSIECEDDSLNKAWELAQKEIWEKAYLLYENALRNGIAKEVARSILPEGLVESTLYVTGTIRDLIFYIKQRVHESTQKEHRLLATSIAEELRPHFPNVLAALEL